MFDHVLSFEKFFFIILMIRRVKWSYSIKYIQIRTLSFILVLYYHFYRLMIILSQNNASKCLLAIMESRHDSENAERILYNMNPKQLVSITLFSSWFQFSPFYFL